MGDVNEFDGQDTADLYIEYKTLCQEHAPRVERRRALANELVRRENIANAEAALAKAKAGFASADVDSLEAERAAGAVVGGGA